MRMRESQSCASLCVTCARRTINEAVVSVFMWENQSYASLSATCTRGTAHRRSRSCLAHGRDSGDASSNPEQSVWSIGANCDVNLIADHVELRPRVGTCSFLKSKSYYMQVATLPFTQLCVCGLWKHTEGS